MKRFKIFSIFALGISQKLQMEADLGLLMEHDGGLILANGGASFALQVIKPIPTFEFGGGCTFGYEDLIKMAEKLDIDIGLISEKTHGGSEIVNTLITEHLVKKDMELTDEIRRRFLKLVPDKTPERVDIKTGIKDKGIENCNQLIDCQFTHDLMPRPCQFGARNQCGTLYVCCDEHHKDETICPKGAYTELKRYLDLEDSLGRNHNQRAYCIRISSAHKSLRKAKRSIGKYWAHGGVLNSLTGGYTDAMVNIEELERKNKDNQLETSILENKHALLRMNLEFTELQTRLNNHICDLTKDLITNMLHFEATIIFNELQMEVNMAMQSCDEGFLPLGIPNQKLVHICKDILGNDHAACYMPYSLFSCKNAELYLENNRIKHVMEVHFSKPLEGFEARRIHTLPLPIENQPGKYARLELGSKIIFEKKGLSQRIIFEKCEKRKTFGLCEIGSQHQVWEDKCLNGILNNNHTDIKENCNIEVLQGDNCIFRIIDGNVFISSHEVIKIYRTESAQLGFEEQRLIQKEKGFFRINEGFVNFNCGEIIYQNIRIPNVEIEEGSISLEFQLKDLPVKFISLVNDETETDDINYETIGFYSFGLLITIGSLIWIGKRIKNRILVEITARRIERLRAAITPGIERAVPTGSRHEPSLVSMD